MNSFQRVVKYCAIAFAVVLAVGIISGIVSATIAVVSGIGSGFSSNEEDRKNFAENFSDVERLDINNSTGTLEIKTGDTVRVEAENVRESFRAKVTGNGTLEIESDNNFIDWINGFLNGNNPFKGEKITVYLPEELLLEKAFIDCGTGNVTIEKLNTERLELNAGTGNMKASDIVAQKADIDGGVGNIDLMNVSLTDAEIDCGVGEMEIDGEILGHSSIDCGVGNVDIKLDGRYEDYDLDVESGLGSVYINGERVKETKKSNSQNDDLSLEVDGGLGNIRLDFAY
ncbi:MAG: putative rane protein [Herbinix sp.]|jgi:hypothetical protein|nr:putative rane protein [Herbinix sp.]